MIPRVALSVGLLTAVLTTAASATNAPLREITAGPDSTAVCGNVVVHANAAISAVLRDDALLKTSIARLRAIDFENFTGPRKTGEGELQRNAAEIGESSDHGRDEVKRLRDYADHPAGTDRSADLRPFADALDVTLDRQKKMALDMLGFLGALDLKELREIPQTPSPMMRPDDVEPGSRNGPGLAPSAVAPPAPLERPVPPNVQARNEAADLDVRLNQNGVDEARAQERSEAAVGGC